MRFRLTLDFNTFESHGDTQSIFHTTPDLFIMISSCHVEYLVVKSILATNFPIIDEPLVAGFVDRRIGDCIAMESSLKKVLTKK